MAAMRVKHAACCGAPAGDDTTHGNEERSAKRPKRTDPIDVVEYSQQLYKMVDKKLHAARKRCSSQGWTTKAEVSLLCEFWSRLANGEPSYRFAFNGFSAKAVYDKLRHMEKVLNDPKLFQMPCATPEKQQGIIISYCKLLADSEGKAKLGKEMEGAEGYMWSKEDDVASTPSSTSAEKEPPLAKSKGDGALKKCP